MNSLFLLQLEPIETRYTGHWKTLLPAQFEKRVPDDVEVVEIYGETESVETTPGAFLDFYATNEYKATQIQKVVKYFQRGEVRDGDYFLVMDAWNPCIPMIRYMADLNGIKINIGGIWHAGSYDPHDFLGRLIPNKGWSHRLERALYYTYDHNFFASKFHINMFCNTLGALPYRAMRTGFPMEYYCKDGFFGETETKQDLVVFPHRMTSEKQPDLFKEIMAHPLLQDVKYIMCQESKLTKEEYHQVLQRSKIVFSANLQETLGIGVYEGMMCDAIPIVPNKLSYSEMYDAEFLYNEHTPVEDLAVKIRYFIDNYDSIVKTPVFIDNKDFLIKNYFSGDIMYDIISRTWEGKDGK